MSHRHKSSSSSSYSKGFGKALSRSNYPQPWSGWTWSEEHGCQMRRRLIAPGNYQYDYGRSNDVATPRSIGTSESQVEKRSEDGLETSFASLTLGESTPQSGLLDPAAFTVIDKPARFFIIGRVFKTLWTEPAGETSGDTQAEYYNDIGYGQKSFTKIRRFVVIRKRLHSSLCLAISTYSGQGTTKANSRSQDHAIVYSDGSIQPLPISGEDITIGAFPIILEVPGEDIREMSRLDFGKIYTVEHNVKVSKVGRISPGHIGRLNECFGNVMGFPPPPIQDRLDAEVPVPGQRSMASHHGSGSYTSSSSYVSPIGYGLSTDVAYPSPNLSSLGAGATMSYPPSTLYSSTATSSYASSNVSSTADYGYLSAADSYYNPAGDS